MDPPAGPQPPRDEVEVFLASMDEFARAVRRARGRAMHRSLTVSQYGLLEPLAVDGTAAVGQLAEAAGITAATATRILDTLERRGLVRRTPSQTDRRGVLVTLTAEGRRRFDAHHDWARQRERAFYAELDPQQRSVAAGLLRGLTKLTAELAAGPPETRQSDR